jgi:uncharacterized membrane protein
MSEPHLTPTSYLTVAPGTAVVDRFGQPVGKVDRVLIHAEGTFDGVIVSTRAGRRFVDAPEVRRISIRAVTLGVAAVDVENPGSEASSRRYGVPAARWDRTEVTEADRDAAIEALKAAFVTDELDADELGRRVEIAHGAETLDRLDAALAGLSLD